MPRRPSTHVDSAAAVGQRLLAARRAAGLTQRELSFPGCTAAYISRIEAGARIPSYQILREFGRRLGVSADYLATGLDEADGKDDLFEAEVALRLGELERAGEVYAHVQRAPEASAAVLARAEAGLGHLALERGDTGEAVGRLEQALGGRLPQTDAATAADALGRAYVAQGRFPDAFDLFGRFLEAAREREDRFEELRFAVLLANAFIDSGDSARAEEVLGSVVELARQSLDPMQKASLYWSRSRLCAAEGHPDLAARFAQLTIGTLEGSEHTLQAAKALLLLAQVENDRGNAQEALDLVDKGEPVLACTGTPGDRAMFVLERARALDELGEHEQAASLALGSVEGLEEVTPPVTAARAYAAAADFFRSRGNTERALELYKLAADEFPAPDRQLADVLTAMAEIYEERGATDDALRLLKSAVAARAGRRGHELSRGARGVAAR